MSDVTVRLSMGDTFLLAANAYASAAAAEAANRTANEIAAMRHAMNQSQTALELLFQCKQWLATSASLVQSPLLKGAYAAQWYGALAAVETRTLPTIADKDLRQCLIDKLFEITSCIAEQDLEEARWMLFNMKEEFCRVRNLAVDRKLQLDKVGLPIGCVPFAALFAGPIVGFHYGHLWIGLVIGIALFCLFFMRDARKDAARERIFKMFLITRKEYQDAGVIPFSNKTDREVFEEYNQIVGRYNAIHMKVYGGSSVLPVLPPAGPEQPVGSVIRVAFLIFLAVLLTLCILLYIGQASRHGWLKN